MTRRASRAHGPFGSSRGTTRRIASESIRDPTIASSAGRSVNAEKAASSTTIAPAIPTERRIMNSNRTRPISPSRTVRPEKNTARPAVAIVASTAPATRSCGGSAARVAISSRNRLVISRE